MEIMEFEKDGVEYSSLVNSINGKIATFSEIATSKKRKEKILLIRHDVDRSIDAALDFAQIEKDAGIRATYFILPSAKYFDYSDELAEKIRTLSKMGHEIGLHNNAIADYYRINKPFKCVWHDIGSLYLFSTLKNVFNIFSKSKTIKDILIEPLNFMRGLNIEVTGTSPHGDRLCTRIGFNNADLWKKHSLSEFDLLYDTSMLSYDCFLGSRLWSGIYSENNKNYGIKIIDKFNSMPYGVFQLLTHPCN